jgi:hypothetical protein
VGCGLFPAQNVFLSPQPTQSNPQGARKVNVPSATLEMAKYLPAGTVWGKIF